MQCVEASLTLRTASTVSATRSSWRSWTWHFCCRIWPKSFQLSNKIQGKKPGTWSLEMLWLGMFQSGENSKIGKINAWSGKLKAKPFIDMVGVKMKQYCSLPWERKWDESGVKMPRDCLENCRFTPLIWRPLAQKWKQFSSVPWKVMSRKILWEMEDVRRSSWGPWGPDPDPRRPDRLGPSTANCANRVPAKNRYRKL